MTQVDSIPVGRCTVTRPHQHRVWVVNMLSDSISIVDLSVTRRASRILVGDDTARRVFTGTGGSAALHATPTVISSEMSSR
jgi:hypothetical protein